MYHKILVPLDGSRFAESALPVALSLSRRSKADLHLVSVHEVIPSFAAEEWEMAARAWSLEYLDAVVQRVEPAAGGAVTSALRSGHVAESLQKEVEDEGADLVVMSTHGRGMLSRLWLGSVADAFVHHTDRPVLLVRPAEDEPAPAAEYAFGTIMVPLDGSELSECALTHAVEFGELYDAAYHLVRIVGYPVDIASPYLPHTVRMNQSVVESARDGFREYLEEHADRLRRRGLRVTTAVRLDAQPGHGILEEGDAVDCNLIAMATHGRAGLSRAFLGSVTDKVVRASELPTLVYRPAPPTPEASEQ